MDSETQPLSTSSATNHQSDPNNNSFTEISRKRRPTRAQLNAIAGVEKRTSPAHAHTPDHSPMQTQQTYPEFTIDLSNQLENETLVLVHLVKGYKGLHISKMKSVTGRNIIKAGDQRATDTLKNIKILFEKSIRFTPLDSSKKVTTATLLRVPHSITPADLMEFNREIKGADRMIAWNMETKSMVQTRTMKI